MLNIFSSLYIVLVILISILVLNSYKYIIFSIFSIKKLIKYKVAINILSK